MAQDLHWFDKMARPSQVAYLRKHPGSKLAQAYSKRYGEKVQKDSRRKLLTDKHSKKNNLMNKQLIDARRTMKKVGADKHGEVKVTKKNFKHALGYLGRSIGRSIKAKITGQKFF